MRAATFDLARSPIESGITLLEASAGTGKTYSLTGLVLRLLLEGRVSGIEKILLVTFTNAATADVKARLRERLRDALLAFEVDAPSCDEFLERLRQRHRDRGRAVIRDTLLRLDEARVQTIHGFCAQVLRESAFETGVPLSLAEPDDLNLLLRETVEDHWRRRMYASSPVLAAIAATQGWSPKLLAADLARQLREPWAEVLPQAPTLSEALTTVEEVADSVRRCWNRAELEALLGACERFNKSGARFTRDELDLVLDQVERFCAEGRWSAFSQLLWLAPDHLIKIVPKKNYGAQLLAEILAHPFVKAVGKLEECTSSLRHAIRLDVHREVPSRFEDAKRRANVMDYDDLLSRVHEAMEDPQRGPRFIADLRQRFDAVLIDEFQDTDLLQWKIFRRLFGNRLLFLVGDPKQAIYGFRGADVFAYLQAQESASRRFTLDRNWRSHPGLVEAINRLFGRRPGAFVLDEIEFGTTVPQLSARERALQGDERSPLLMDIILPPEGTKPLSLDEARILVVRRTIAEIQNLLQAGIRVGHEALHPGHFAVLVRSRFEGELVQRSLQDVGVSAVLAKSGDIHKSEEMDDLVALIEALIEPRRRGRVLRACATLLWGFDAPMIADLRRDDDGWAAVAIQMDRLRERLFERGLMSMAQELLTLRDVRHRWLQLKDGERRLTNLQHAIEVLHHASEEHEFSAAALLSWQKREREREDVDIESRNLRLERDEHAVQIVTMHGCKGLEYEIVLCPFLWWSSDRRKGDPLRIHETAERLLLDYASPAQEGRSQRNDVERLAEDLRLVYVALTRAKRRCVFFAGRVGQNFERSALAYLLQRPDRRPAEDVQSYVQRCFQFLADNRRQWSGVFAGLAAEIDPLGLLEEGSPRKLMPTPREVPRLRARHFPDDARSRLSTWQVASFTSLTRQVAEPQPDYLDPARLDRLAESAEPKGIFAFARGTRAGNCLHEILERVDFCGEGEELELGLIQRVLERHGLDRPDAHVRAIEPAQTMTELVSLVRSQTVPGTRMRLGELNSERRFNEWSFHCPTLRASTAHLGEMFAEYGIDRIASEVPPRLQELPSRRWSGFLAGFVDLVFQHEGRWHVLDWKSNHLGDRPADYDHSSLWAAMLEHHYVLQYHLYVVALHRYLRVRLRDYDYDRHVGAAHYVFLRGLAANGGRGWWWDRPPKDLIVALDRWLQEGSRSS